MIFDAPTEVQDRIAELYAQRYETIEAINSSLAENDKDFALELLFRHIEVRQQIEALRQEWS
jgi:hypothetical protein